MQKMAASTIQSFVRRSFAQKEFTRRELASIVIQRSLRGFQARSHYRQLKVRVPSPLFSLQSISSSSPRISYETIFQVVTLHTQRIWRGFQVRKQLNRQNRAATVLQTR